MPSAPAGARALALEITRRVSRGAFSSLELDRALNATGLDGRDRSFVTDLVYGSLRHRIWLDAALAPRLRDPEGLPEEVREALRLGAYEKLVRGTSVHAAVGEWVEVVRTPYPRLTGLVNAVLRRVEAPVDPPLATELSLPPWLWERIHGALADDAEAAVRAMHQPAPLWLTRYGDGAEDALAAEGCEVQAGPLPRTLRVRPSRPLAQLSAFRSGSVQPQNPASAWVGWSVGAGPGERVLDLCSGSGVKAAQFASAGADVEAFDLSERKLARARANLARLGLAASHRRHDLREIPADVEPALKVVLDAPCSGTGTLRKNPEIPLRASEHELAGLVGLQDDLLRTAAGLTAPGGTLTYAVCALTPDEGPRRIEEFLVRHPHFVPTPLVPPLPHRTAGPGVYLLPVDGLDGFFVASLTRRADAARGRV